MLDETTILALIGMILVSLFAMTALKMWYSLKVSTKSQNQIKVLQSQFRGNANKIQEITEFLNNAANTPPNTALAGIGPDMNIKGMSLDEAAVAFGLDLKDINNPLVRPLAEKVFASLQQKAMEKNPTDERAGF